jgi:oligopeptide transport system substrate-binding protein
MRLPFLLPASLLFLLFAAGCTKHETPAAAGIRTQTLLVGNSAEPADLDPQTAAVLSDQNILMALFEGLTALDEQTAQAVPAAAERWEVSGDGLTWTFHLRDGLKWSNGDALTADDFVQSWRRVLIPALAAENASYLYALKNAEAINGGKLTDATVLGASAPDPRTVVLTLERPTPYLPALVSLPAWFPVNVRVLAKFGPLTQRGTPWTRAGNLVGNGPFSLKEWTQNARIVTVQNPHYWDAAHRQLQSVVFLPIENSDTEERDFRAGQLHLTFTLPVSKLATWREKDPAKLRVDPLLQIIFLRLNTKKPPLDDPRVRRALSLAVDRDTLARTVLAGSRAPAHSFTPPGTGSYTARAHLGTDFEAARKLLAAAGHPGGRDLPTLEIQTLNNDLHAKLAEALQAIWQRELGIRVTIAPTEQRTWIQNQQSLNYAISTAAWTADFPDPVTFLGLFPTGGTYNWTGWSNAAYDHLLDTAALTTDAAKRAEIFQQAETLLLDEAPVAPICFGAQIYLIDAAVKNWAPAPLVFHRYQLTHLEN